MRGVFTQEDWHKLVQKELKDGQKLEDLVYKSPEGLKYDPFRHETEIFQNLPTLPNVSWKSTILGVGKCAGSILDGLANGAESIFVTVAPEQTLEQALHPEVRLDFVDLLIENDGGDNILGDALLAPYGQLYDKINFLVSNELADLDAQKAHQCIYSLNRKSTTESWKNAIPRLSAYYQDQSNQFGLGLYLPSTDFFYDNIARFRAILLLDQELRNQFIREDLPPITLIVVPDLTSFPTEDANQKLIAETYMVLSAVIGGASYICTQAFSDGRDNSYARLSLHIQNILKHESHLNLYQDPAKGSFFLEDLTQQYLLMLKDMI